MNASSSESRKYHNPALHDAARSYVISAIDLLRKLVSSKLPEIDIDAEALSFARLEYGDDLRSLTEYTTCIRILSSDPEFARQMNVVAGPRGGPRSLNTDAKGLMWQLPELGLPPGQNAFDDDYFEKEYGTLEKAYYDSNIEYYAVAPLNGFIANASIELSDDIEIVEVSEEDFSPAVKARRAAAKDSPWIDKAYAVRIRYSLPKAIGEEHAFKPQYRDEDDEIRKAINQQVSEVVTALRFHGIESVYVPGILHKTSRWSMGQNLPFPGQFQPEIHFSMTVTLDWLRQFKDFWQTLQTNAVRSRNFLMTAIRRFGYAHERYRSEDKIIDLLIAAEALLLSDGSYTGEVKYRLAQRTALFLTETSSIRKIIFKRMGVAYDLRSKVAHGGSYTRKLPEKSDGSIPTLDEFVWQIQEYLRLAILKAVNLTSQPNAPFELVSWDELLFPDCEVKSSE